MTFAPLWPHQQEALRACRQDLAAAERTLLVMACGTGKTRVGAVIAEHIAPSQPVLFVVPTLDLLSQTLTAWLRASGPAPLGRVTAVCSDQEVTDRDAQEELRTLNVQVTTGPARLADILTRPGRHTVGVTYQSLRVLADAHRDHRAPGWKLIIIDEAHRSAGRRTGHWSAVHDNSIIPADRRLYMTATPRIVTGGGDGPGDTVVSMNDGKTYGRVSYRLPYAVARQRRLLAGYRVVVAVSTDSEVRRLASGQNRGQAFFGVEGPALAPGMLAKQLAVLRAAEEFGSTRMLTYHHRVKDARWFAATLAGARALLGEPATPRPLVPGFVHGGHSGRHRRDILSQLSSPGPELVVISNARVLSEGVDAPAVDAIAMIDARNSPIDTVQNIGRALRLDGRPDKIATIIIPVVLEPDQDPQAALESSAYAPVWRVIQGLRDYDDDLAERLAQMRTRLGRQPADTVASTLPDWLHFSGIPVPPSFASAIAVRAVRAASTSWEEYFGAASEFRDRQGSLRGLSDSTVTPSGLKVGAWIVRQRQAAEDGTLLPERRTRLDALGMIWDPRQAHWQRNLAALRAYREEHGSLRIPSDHITAGKDPIALGAYVVRLRNGLVQLTNEQKAVLDKLGMVWDVANHIWDEYLHAARAYRELEGDLLVPVAHVTATDPPLNLGFWIVNLRARYKRGDLSAKQIRQLEALDMVWDANAHQWNLMLKAATTYRAQNGNLLVPQRHRTRPPESLGLGTWIAKQRTQFNLGKLTVAQVEALTAIDMVWFARNQPRGTSP